jgi:hypothetical protein
MSEDVFAHDSRFYGLLYRDNNYRAGAAHVAGVLGGCAPIARTLLGFAPGAGQHGRLLADEGFEVLGVEGTEGVAVERDSLPMQEITRESTCLRLKGFRGK